MTIGGKGQTFTVTSDHKLPGDLTLRLEYYLDTTKDPFFENSKGDLKKSQSTLTAGVVYAFGGKI
jgi:secreted Zn-dependent insulinase-like peptidase